MPLASQPKERGVKPQGTPLRGLGLRFVIADMLQRSPEPMRITDIVETIHKQGFTLAGRPSKAVSDSLRTEVRKHRVRRLSRGVYQFVSASRSTLRRINVMANQCRTWVVAQTRAKQTPWDNHHWIWRI